MTGSVYWIKGAQPHKIAIVARPRGNEWLSDDIERLSHEGIDVLVSMLTPEESAELGLSEEERVCDHCGIRFFNFPITDRSVPDEISSRIPRPPWQAPRKWERRWLSLQSRDLDVLP